MHIAYNLLRSHAVPNYCHNNVTFTHADPHAILELAKALEAAALFTSLLPLPDGVWSYPGALEHWGTKWDIKDPCTIASSDNSYSATFDTAWTPPLAAYRKLEALGYGINAYYIEPGCGVAGYYATNIGEEHINYGTTPLEAIKHASLRKFITHYGNS